MRGGTANCSVVLSDKAVGSPVFARSTELIALNEPSLVKFEAGVLPGGTVFVNSDVVTDKVSRTDLTAYYIPVSYTHLDVYKRQSRYRPAWNRPGSPGRPARRPSRRTCRRWRRPRTGSQGPVRMLPLTHTPFRSLLSCSECYGNGWIWFAPAGRFPGLSLQMDSCTRYVCGIHSLLISAAGKWPQTGTSVLPLSGERIQRGALFCRSGSLGGCR